MKRGKLITIEGIEGAGKSTARSFILNYLEKKGLNVIATREPGGTDIAEEIRNVLLHRINSEAMLSETELLLMFASRAQHIRHLIEPNLQAGNWVLSDRYVDASYAYQGGGRGLEIDFIQMLDRFVVRELYPDVTFLLDVSAELGLSRTDQRGEKKDRIEQEKIDFFKKVRTSYLERAKKDPSRIKLINANLSLAEVHRQLQNQLEQFMAEVTE